MSVVASLVLAVLRVAKMRAAAVPKPGKTSRMDW